MARPKVIVMADRLFAWSMSACALLMVAALLWVLGDVIGKGLPHIAWDFLVSAPENAGHSGGIAPILVSTLWILLIALVVAVPLGLGVAVWLSEFAPAKSRFTRTTGIILDILAGVPSIVYGLFGNAFFGLYLGLGFSLLSGALTLSCMILPIFVRTCESGLRAVNNDWRRGALSLGMTRSAAIRHLIIPNARPAIIAGLILGLGRVTAETAALLYTSGYVSRMPHSLLDSGRTLSVHIYDLTMNVTGGDPAAYASALVLVILIMAISLLAQGLVDNWFKHRLVLT